MSTENDISLNMINSNFENKFEDIDMTVKNSDINNHENKTKKVVNDFFLIIEF